MVEIKYDAENEKYILSCDGRDDWTEDELSDYLRGLGHSKVVIGIGVPYEVFDGALKIKDDLMKIIDAVGSAVEKKDRRQKMRDAFFAGKESYNLNNRFTRF